jgi:peptidoglycan biosynthesis protein MviN/MurJ (putative lipid II flippase)
MTINYYAVLCAAVAAWIAGAIWYTALGGPWKTALGWSAADIQSRGKTKPPIGPFIISFIAELIMAAILAGLMGHFGDVTIKTGAIVGGLCWLGFVATTITVNNAYPGRKFALTIIDAGHWLLVLLIQGAIIGAFG